MSEDKKADKKVSTMLRSKIQVPDKSFVLQVSSASVSSKHVSTLKKSVLSKLFSWNREKPRPGGEYLDKKFGEPFNVVAPELRVIGGLGPIKCVGKEKQPLINRPTQVQKLCHTKTKLLPNFTLTEQLRPVKCRKKKKMRVVETAERVKFAENLPTPTLTPVPSETKETFNHQNPFNLDLNALSAYQKQKHNAEKMERRRNYQIIRRTMETKALKTEGAERIKQEARDEKFKFPEFFQVLKMENIKSESLNDFNINGCQIISTIDKPKNREIVKRHYQHKEEKLRQRIYKKAKDEKQLAKEMKEVEKEERENFVFRLAEESLAASECDANENVAMKELPSTYKRFDYPISKLELLKFQRQLHEKSLDEIKKDKLLAPTVSNDANDEGEEIGITCGQKIGNRVILRGFHDRLCTEPRGEKNYYHLEKSGMGTTCLTHSQWLDTMANDPEILKQPPRAKLLSSMKVEKEPNNDKTILFDSTSKTLKKRTNATEGPIRQYIRQVNEKMRNRMLKSHPKKAENHMNKFDNCNMQRNQISNRHRRMKFMGIPAQQTPPVDFLSMKVSRSDLNAIVAKVSKPSLLLLSHEISSDDKSTLERKHSNAIFPPQVAMLKPKIPQFDCKVEEERERLKLDKFVPFKKAQPRGTNARNLRADKSLPWIEDELNATKVKLQKNSRREGTFNDGISESGKTTSKVTKKKKENPSAIKKSFNEIIAKKLQDYNPPNKNEMVQDSESSLEIQSIESSSSLSSTGTNFTNDSGSVLMFENKSIPTREMNAEKKFLNQSLVTAKEISVIEPNPYFIPRIEQFEMIKEMCKPKDRFHTYRTRSCANIRERIQIESSGYDEELFETEAFKMVSKMATDIDEYYQSEFYSERSHMSYCFKPQTEIEKLRETLRKKMDIYWMKEQIVKGEIEAQRNEKIVEWTKTQMDEYENFLTSQKENTFRSTNRVMQEVKGYYLATGVFQKQLNLLEMQIEPLKMSIFNSGNDYIRLAIIQNFQYLLKPLEWRESHDFIHKTSDDKLESFKESIEKRDKVNIWDRTNVGVFTIKNFVEEFFSVQNHRPVKVFDHGLTLLEAFKELRSKSCIALLQYQSFAQNMADAQKEFIAIEERNTVNFNKFTNLVNNLSQQKLFLENRSKNIKHFAMKITDRPLEDSVAAEKLRTTKGLIDLIFQKVLSTHANEDNSSSYMTHFEKVSQLELKVFDILDKLDQVPRDILNQAEAEARNQRKLKWRDANKAYRIETELKQRIDQFQRCLEKPKKKEKREGKLPISVMPKKAKKDDPRFSILTPLEKDYIRAFTEFGVDGEVKFDKAAKKMIDRIKNESVPFYVDHLLDSIGIKIKKDTRKSIDNIMAEEEKHFKYKDLLPKVRNGAQLQALQRERIKKENIRKTSYLYEP